ncbi:helix-turn-helix transcriptional regulator [Nocardia nova]|jgi:hypothetical protein|uniref:helix-turn-helix transcriptional regulator n=1 Tax=Nocardia nova TaxID=37330 RepID=UPI0025B2106F|nr:helix-turn-helix domain-containing protein [Nocardia nova]
MASIYSWAHTFQKRVSMGRTRQKDIGAEADHAREGESACDETCWDIDDVAKFFKVTPDTVREWRRHGYGPPPRKVGRHLRWVPEEVHDWFRDLPTDNAA